MHRTTKNKCPVCGARIECLYWRSIAEGDLWRDWQFRTGSTDTEFFCPKCRAVLFSNRENAAAFLRNKSYPNATTSYHCDRCHAAVTQVNFQVCPRGDLCEKCRKDFEETNVKCKVMDGGSVDYVTFRELAPLRQIKKKTGKPLSQQVTEAIKDYADKHTLFPGGSLPPNIRNRFKRFGDQKPPQSSN